jgi:hypothetical protein
MLSPPAEIIKWDDLDSASTHECTERRPEQVILLSQAIETQIAAYETAMAPTPSPTRTKTPRPTAKPTATRRPPAPVKPSGKIAFYSDRDGNREIYVMNVDGSGVTCLTVSFWLQGGFLGGEALAYRKRQRVPQAPHPQPWCAQRGFLA